LRVAEQERDVIVRFAERLRADGIEVPEVSVGSTPTMSVAEQLAGVTEMRPGNYVFYDAFQAAIGSCALDHCAFSVLASVIGVYPGRVVVDAGALALSKDAGTGDGGYGVVLGQGAFQVASLSQEHGVVRVHADSHTRVGDQLRIIANHSCLAAACHDAYHVVRGDEVVDVWRPTRGW
jgi:D-serine deaminase-like pyridoxal phosphate-dependent protein